MPGYFIQRVHAIDVWLSDLNQVAQAISMFVHFFFHIQLLFPLKVSIASGPKQVFGACRQTHLRLHARLYQLAAQVFLIFCLNFFRDCLQIFLLTKDLFPKKQALVIWDCNVLAVLWLLFLFSFFFVLKTLLIFLPALTHMVYLHIKIQCCPIVTCGTRDHYKMLRAMCADCWEK